MTDCKHESIVAKVLDDMGMIYVVCVTCDQTGKVYEDELAEVVTWIKDN